jgi:adenylosuccinate lyase
MTKGLLGSGGVIVKDNKRAYQQAYYLKNKERIVNYGKQYYQKNKQRLKDAQRERYATTRDKLKALESNDYIMSATDNEIKTEEIDKSL